MPADLVTRLLLKNDQFDKSIKASTAQVKSFDSQVLKMGKSFAAFSIGMTGFVGMAAAIRSALNTSFDFEKSLSSLQSIVGATTQEMSYFKAEAIRLGATTTQTASQVAEAFQLIGGQAPELLKNKTALTQVTEHAIVLAEAAGITVPEAAKALVGSLNQMGAEMSKSSDYINILAAAAQEGAAEIPYLNTAIEKSGGTASSVGVKFNELVAAIEAIAPKITEASIAGNNLRNIFLRMEASTDNGIKPSVVGFTDALENLAKKQLDVTQLTKMFGRESVTAVLALINAKDTYKELTTSITDTNAAFEQQAINNDNVRGAINSLSSAWEGFILTVNGSNGVLKETANLFTSILNDITKLFQSNASKDIEKTNKLSKAQIESAKAEIAMWERLGKTRKEARELTKERYINVSEDIGNEIKQTYTSISQLEMGLKRFNPKSDFDKAAHSLVPYSHLSYNENSQRREIDNQINAQQELIRELKIKEEVQKNILQYLEDEMLLLSKTGNTNPLGDVDAANISISEVQKKIQEVTTSYNEATSSELRSVFAKQKKELEQLLKELQGPTDAEREKIMKLALAEQEKIMKLALAEQEIKGSVRDQIEKAFSNDPVKVPATISLPSYVSSDEVGEWDISGSIAEAQKKIQDTTLKYNYATSAELRSIYAQQLADLEKHLKDMQGVNDALIDVSQLAQGLVTQGFAEALEGLGNSVAANDPGEAMRGMLISLLDLLQQFGKALVAAGVAKMAFDKLFLNPYAAIAAGGVLIATSVAAKSALQKAATPFADGGVVYGETFARIGEYSGVSSNPEVVAPLNKLKSLIPSTSGDVKIAGEWVMRGTDMIAVIKNTERVKSRGR